MAACFAEVSNDFQSIKANAGAGPLIPLIINPSLLTIFQIQNS